MTQMPHQIITRAIGGTVYVVTLRDPSGEGASHTVGYENRGGAQRWLSKHRYSDVSQADAGALTLADFLGCEVRP
ncbi:hypothetical protein [Bradyrhizobium sp. JYMT SZCCT0428]|uniref:hypothetical protein n=1 Tax=Bradyrhizobium sp. JYMT SZCCT0428 TaxID=2807673 RepID=UPI001BA5ACF1|nr:hypothetical protein [Bradyrhizobium sp. JYMT SZCCT0428]MBR1151933.1 hypothetical protein [Bradyrhizobium sp. JYMT SZCCT0428]